MGMTIPGVLSLDGVASVSVSRERTASSETLRKRANPIAGKRNQGRRQVCLDFGLKASMVLLLGSFVSGCATTEQNGVSNESLSAPVQVAVVAPETPPPDPKDPWRDLIAE